MSAQDKQPADGAHHFVLTAEQQNVLLNALNVSNPLLETANTMAPQVSQPADPIFPFDYDFNSDPNFDFDFSGDNKDLIGDTSLVSNKSDMDEYGSGSGSASASGSGSSPAKPKSDSAEKRSLPDDIAEENNNAESSSKKREGQKPKKVPKKPGRKPLTEEPTTKRKAQNRAAQRAFRERKEKHVRDLENKVDELQKASDDATTENSALRSQIERLNTELEQYKRAVQQLHKGRSASDRAEGFGSAAVNNIADINFQFEFPKFGSLPGPPTQSITSPTFPAPTRHSTASVSSTTSPLSKTNHAFSNPGGLSLTQQDFTQFSTVFSPGVGPSTGTTPTSVAQSQGKSSTGGNVSGAQGYGNTSSPSASSNSNQGASSSCGTSPEPFNQSPMSLNKPVDSLATIGEETSPFVVAGPGFGSGFGNLNVNFDWPARQNNGQFDPQLFGDYREPQENIMSLGLDDANFFDYDADFMAPYNAMMSAVPEPVPAKGANLIQQIDAQKESDDLGDDQKLPCNQLWDKLQKCPKVQAGEFDLDALCGELQKKATCSGKGPVVKQVDFNTILHKYLGKSCAEEVSTGAKANST